MKSKNIATLAIHGGDTTYNRNNEIFPPITTSSSFTYKNIGECGKFTYTRGGNPTRYAYETAIRDIEGGVYATATSSGMAASTLVLELLPKDSHVIVMDGVYGGTFRLFEDLNKGTSGTTFTYVDLNNIAEVKAAVQDNTKLIWIESPTNPLLELVDLERICKFAKEEKIPTCVDNTFSTAWNQRPFDFGADIIVLSTTKYIGGHSDMTGGAVVTSCEDIAKKLDLIKTTVGTIASPFDSYLALRGLKTLAVRMKQHCSNAQQVAEFLEKHEMVEKVYYPGLASHPQHDICKKQMKTGGAVVTFQLKGTLDDVKTLISKLECFVLADSLGGVESMINHSYTMSHGSMSHEQKVGFGITETTLRLSVGIEDIEDILIDLTNALDVKSTHAVT